MRCLSETRVFKRRRAPSPARRTAIDDWIRALPLEKNELFQKIVRDWECSYAMMSVSLDEALARRARGELVCAQQQVGITSDLVLRLNGVLLVGCAAMAKCGKSVGDLPIVQPLHTDFFRGDTAQSAASWNSLLHNVLLGHRSRFFHKLRILATTIERLGQEFEQTAGDITASTCVDPGVCWKHLDSLHFDLNTCLRESEIILKSFLRSLPGSEISAFEAEMSRPPASRTTPAVRRSARVSA
jgi:hypothetical protein